MKEKTKYNMGAPVDSTKLEQNEVALAISDWAEGDEALINTITSCIDNSIPTFASCAGHSITDSPYLTMIITPQNLGQILNIMEKLSNKKGITFNLTLQPNLEDESQCRSLLTVYANMLNKKQCFQTIAESAKQSIKPEQASILVQTLWDMHKASRTHGCSWNRLYNSISFCNGIISKRIDINSTAQSFEFKNIIQNAQLKRQQNMLGQTIYTKSSLSDKTLIKKVRIITDGINDTFIVNENDEFSNLNPRREFADNLKAEPNGEIIETNEHDEATIQQGEDQR